MSEETGKATSMLARALELGVAERVDLVGARGSQSMGRPCAWRGAPFRATSTADTIDIAGALVVRPLGSYESSQIGYAVDLRADRTIALDSQASVGYRHFVPGDASPGRTRASDCFYAGFGYTF